MWVVLISPKDFLSNISFSYNLSSRRCVAKELVDRYPMPWLMAPSDPLCQPWTTITAAVDPILPVVPGHVLLTGAVAPANGVALGLFTEKPKVRQFLKKTTWNFFVLLVWTTFSLTQWFELFNKLMYLNK